MRKSFWLLLFFICLAPHTIVFLGLLYPDGIFAVAASGLLFEIWLIARERKINPASFFIITLTVPFALFARANGIIFLTSLACALFFINSRDKIKLILISCAWCLLIFVASKSHQTNPHGALFPLAVFETVNFLQNRPMNIWREDPRVSEKTINILTRNQSLDQILRYYDRDYWDPLVYNPNGPHLGNLTKKDRRIIIQEFLRYNLWHNIPAFISSRVNIFIVAALAQGGFISLDYSEDILNQVNTESKFRLFHLEKLENFLKTVYFFSEKYRWILWTPFIGIYMIFLLIQKGLNKKDKPMLLVAASMFMQLLGIFIFSIAGEYRYLLIFFIFPLAALPILTAATFEKAKAVS